MIAVKVWALVIVLTSYNGGGPTVIDDLPSRQECQRVSRILVQAEEHFNPRSVACVEHWKLVPKSDSRQ